MAKSRYEYGTNPQKLEPDIRRKQQTKKRNIRVVEDLPKQRIKPSKEQQKRQIKSILLVFVIFVLLLTISYRKSQINEKFNQVQTLKKELSSVQKENEQLKVNIENNLNLSVIKKQAKEKLGMQELTNKQTVYINLPKKDYVESATEEVVEEKEGKNWFEKLIDKILKK